MRGSASPQGEARRERAAKPKRSDGRGREAYGWGRAGGVTKLPLLQHVQQGLKVHELKMRQVLLDRLLLQPVANIRLKEVLPDA
jgi:hypothetical protein